MNVFRLNINLSVTDGCKVRSNSSSTLFFFYCLCMPQLLPTVAARLFCSPIGYCPRTCFVRVSVRRQHLNPQREVQVVLGALASNTSPVRVTPDDSVVWGYLCGALTGWHVLAAGPSNNDTWHGSASGFTQWNYRLSTADMSTTTAYNNHVFYLWFPSC